MLKILRKKVLRAIPVWLIIAILFSAGTAFAAFTWISNYVAFTQTVTAPPITLSRSAFGNQYLYIYYMENYTYTVNLGYPSGYLYIRSQGNFTTTNDMSLAATLTPDGSSQSTTLTNVPGYPKYTSGNWGLGKIGMIEWLMRNYTSSGPIDFGSWVNGHGNITLNLYASKPGDCDWFMQVSSTSS
jgi:hypothetical protein